MKAIQVGDMIPDFSLKDQDGNMVNISNFRGKKKLVIFFFPQDDFLGSAREACYLDLSEAFDEVGAVVIGISEQSVESHKDFVTKYKINYPLLSDQENKVRKLFNVPSLALRRLPGRVTYVTNNDGKIIHVFNAHLQPKRHEDEALKIYLLLKKTDNTPVYTLSVTADLSGIPINSIRQYIDKGLMIPFKKESSRNLFSQLDILRLKYIHKLLEKDGLNIAGIRALQAVIPCWAIRRCSNEERDKCQAYISETCPCWEASEKGTLCKNTNCRECEVYRLVENYPDLKSFLKTLIP